MNNHPAECRTGLYGVRTFRFNEAVKRNLDRFPEDFMFRLTKSECLHD